jgi:hypothetical protein
MCPWVGLIYLDDLARVIGGLMNGKPTFSSVHLPSASQV